MPTAEERDLLKPTVPVKPSDLGPEFVKLQAITDALNRARSDVAVPAGAKPNVAGEYSAPSGLDGATTTLEDPIFGSPIPKSNSVVQQAAPQLAASEPPTPAPVAATPPQVSPVNLRRVFFTGKSGASKSYLTALLGATEFTIQKPILDLLAEYFPGQQEHLGDFVNLCIYWGEGYVSDKVPITATRLLFANLARQKFGKDFGTPGFWTRRLLDAALECPGPAIITTVTEEKQATALKEASFEHFHLMCSNPTLQTRNRRKNANDGLANSLDNQVLKAISLQREGPKLKAVWVDQAAPPISGRLYSMGEFIATYKASVSDGISGGVAGE